jgi:hypothetical protein
MSYTEPIWAAVLAAFFAGIAVAVAWEECKLRCSRARNKKRALRPIPFGEDALHDPRPKEKTWHDGEWIN